MCSGRVVGCLRYWWKIRFLRMAQRPFRISVAKVDIYFGVTKLRRPNLHGLVKLGQKKEAVSCGADCIVSCPL